MGTLTEGIVIGHSIVAEYCTQSDHVMGAEKPFEVVPTESIRSCKSQHLHCSVLGYTFLVKG